MAVKIYWIYETENNGRIGIMARPRGNEWLAEEIGSLRKQRVDTLVSLKMGVSTNPPTPENPQPCMVLPLPDGINNARLICIPDRD